MTNSAYRDNPNRIVIFNPKGGCGKTTLAINLASHFALRGPTPTLVDTDPKGYTSRWLERRPADCSLINGVVDDEFVMHGRRGWSFRSSRDAGAVIVDTPAALGQREIAELTYDADCILIPILPSIFDVQVTSRFVAELLLITDFELPIAVVANRTQKNTRSLAMLMRTLDDFEIPTIAVLRNSQNYVSAAAFGLGICEMPHYAVKQDLEQFDPIIEWLDQQLMRTLAPGMFSRLGALPGMISPPP